MLFLCVIVMLKFVYDISFRVPTRFDDFFIQNNRLLSSARFKFSNCLINFILVLVIKNRIQQEIHCFVILISLAAVEAADHHNIIEIYNRFFAISFLSLSLPLLSLVSYSAEPACRPAQTAHAPVSTLSFDHLLK